MKEKEEAASRSEADLLPSWLGRAREYLVEACDDDRVRIAAQFGTGVFLLMVTLSPYKVWDSLTLDPVLGNPTLVMLLFFLMSMLTTSGAGVTAVQVAAEGVAGAVMGGGASIAIAYASVAVTGGTYQLGLPRAATVISLSGFLVWLWTQCRFRWVPHGTFWLMSLVTVGLTSAASYYKLAGVEEFPLFWMAFVAIAGASVCLSFTFVLPRTCSRIARRSLAAGLESYGAFLEALLDLMSGPVTPAGSLQAASGDMRTLLGVDSGLYASGLRRIHELSDASVAALGFAWRHMPATAYELDVYRRQKRFPLRAFETLGMLGRTTLSSSHQMLYPLQTGRMRCAPFAARRAELLAFAAAMRACVGALADVLRDRRALRDALRELRGLEEAYAALAASLAAPGQARRRRGAPPSRFRPGAAAPASREDTLTSQLVLSTLFIATTRVRRIFLVMPATLGADDRGSAEAVLEHVSAGAGWDFAQLAEGPRAVGRDSVSVLGSAFVSTVAAGREGDAEAAAAAFRARLLERATARADVEAAPERPAPPPLSRWGAFLDRVRRRTGWTEEVMRLGVQGVVGYAAVFVLLAVPAVNDSFDGRLYWALFIVIAVLESNMGAVVRKLWHRLLGTLVGIALGLGSVYFTYLCNGLSYERTPLKCFVMSLCLTLIAAGVGACVIPLQDSFYAVLITGIITVTTALPAYGLDEPMPELGLWRLVNTLLGIGVQLICTVCVFPVTARRTFMEHLAATLDHLAGVAETAFECVAPREHRRLHPWMAAAHPAGVGGGADAGVEDAASDAGAEDAASDAGAEYAASDAGTYDGRGLPGEALLGPRLGQQAGVPPSPSSDARASAASVPAATPDAAGGEGLPPAPCTAASLPLSAAMPPPLPPLRIAPAPETSPMASAARAARQGSASRSLFAELVPEREASFSLKKIQPWTSLVGAAVATQSSVGGGSEGGEPESPAAPPPSGRSLSPAPTSWWRRALGLPAARAPECEILHVLGDGVYVRLRGVEVKLLGSAYVKQTPAFDGVIRGVLGMMSLMDSLKFEFYVVGDAFRFPFANGARAQRLCRHALNVLGTFVVSVDTFEVTSVPFLLPHARALDAAITALRDCLGLMASLVRGHVGLRPAAEAVLRLELLTQRLFLQAAAGGGEELGTADVALGMTVLASLFNGAYVVRVLAIVVVQAFFRDDPEAQDCLDALADEKRWAFDERLMRMANDIMGMAVGGRAVPAGAGPDYGMAVASARAAPAERLPGARPPQRALSTSNLGGAAGEPEADGPRARLRWALQLARGTRDLGEEGADSESEELVREFLRSSEEERRAGARS